MVQTLDRTGCRVKRTKLLGEPVNRKVGTDLIEGIGAPVGHYSMLGWALTFLVIAIIAAIFGFGGVAGTAVGIAKILFWVFIAIFVISLLFGLIRGRRP